MQSGLSDSEVTLPGITAVGKKVKNLFSPRLGIYSGKIRDDEEAPEVSLLWLDCFGAMTAGRLTIETCFRAITDHVCV